jgi:hypothetical protein
MPFWSLFGAQCGEVLGPGFIGNSEVRIMIQRLKL